MYCALIPKAIYVMHNLASHVLIHVGKTLTNEQEKDANST